MTYSLVNHFLLNQISLENVARDDRNHNQFADTNGIYEDIDDDIREVQVTSNASDDDIRKGQVTSNASSFQGNYENLPQTRFSNVAISLFQGVSRSNDMFWEFPSDWLSIERQLGKGNFGSVKADFHSAENIARSTFSAHFLLNCSN